jgi:hypothetical protein
VKIFHDQQKLKQVKVTKATLQKIPKEILHTEEEDKYNQENTGKNKSY